MISLIKLIENAFSARVSAHFHSFILLTNVIFQNIFSSKSYLTAVGSLTSNPVFRKLVLLDCVHYGTLMKKYAPIKWRVEN
jgi:hypothetical protein